MGFGTDVLLRQISHALLIIYFCADTVWALAVAASSMVISSEGGQSWYNPHWECTLLLTPSADRHSCCNNC